MGKRGRKACPAGRRATSPGGELTEAVDGRVRARDPVQVLYGSPDGGDDGAGVAHPEQFPQGGSWRGSSFRRPVLGR
jgi:hypothetical protein